MSKKLEDFKALQRTVLSKLSPLSRRHLEKLEHSAVQEHTQAVIVQNELKQVRQLAVDTEVRKRSKRIQKGVNQRSWDLQQVINARRGLKPSKVRILERVAGEKLVISVKYQEASSK